MSESLLPLIKVVGVSASGKSTLVHSLRQAGYNARPISQEHSNVRDLWNQFDHAFILIFLNANLEAQIRRRPDVSWDKAARLQEVNRLADAVDHADLQVDTSHINAEEVLQIVMIFLNRLNVRHHHGPLPPVPPTGSAKVN